MAGLTRDALLTGAPREVVPVATDIGTCFIRELSGADRDQYEYFMQVTVKSSWKNARAKLVQLSVCTESGDLLFTPAELDEVGDINAKILDPIFRQAITLNGLEDDAIALAEKKS